MDHAITEFLTKNFTEVLVPVSISEVKYISGIIHGDRYLISKHNSYIITKKVNNTDKYMAVLDSCAEVCNLLMAIKNKEVIVANQKAKFLSLMTGFDTI